MPDYRVRVTKDYTVFCSGHFITYAGGKCEALHGHNYRAAASLEGALNADHYVFDFVTLKKILRNVCDRLDHRMLLPLRNPLIDVLEADGEVEVRFKTRRYVFPREDCVLLPIANTTAELLAEWIAGEVRATLFEKGPIPALTALEVEVEETVGQTAFCRIMLEEKASEE